MKRNDIYILSVAIIFSIVILMLSGDLKSGVYTLVAITIGIIFIFAVINYPLLSILFIILYAPFTNLIAIPGIQSGGRLAGLLAAVAWFMKYLLGGKTIFFNQLKFNAISLCFILTMILSSALAIDPMRSFRTVAIVTLYIMMSFFIQDFIRDKRNLTIIITVLAISIGAASMVVLFQYLFASESGDSFGRVMYSQSGELSRLGGFDTANAYAVLLMSGIPSLLFLSFNARNSLFRLICLLFFVTSFISLGLTVARTHIFAFIVFIVMYILIGMKNHIINKKTLLILLIVVVILSVLFSNIILELIMKRSITLEDNSSSVRFLIMGKGLQLLLENPVFGIGFNNFGVTSSNTGKYEYLTGISGHDLLSRVFVSIGIPGMIILILMFYRTYNCLHIAQKNYARLNDRYSLNLVLILKAAFIALLSTSLGNDIISYNIFWIYVALAIILQRLSTQEMSSERLKIADMDLRYR